MYQTAEGKYLFEGLLHVAAECDRSGRNAVPTRVPRLASQLGFIGWSLANEIYGPDERRRGWIIHMWPRLNSQSQMRPCFVNMQTYMQV